MANRLSWRMELEQSALYFTQDILRSDGNEIDRRTGRNKQEKGAADRQSEYFVKGKLLLSRSLSLLSSYHYLYTNYRSNTNQSHLGLLGIKYNGRVIDLQGDINFGRSIDESLKQYNLKMDFYPLGNLNLYSTSRVSLLDLASSKKYIFNQAFGLKVIKKTWTESSVTVGNQDDYIEADGLYIYNAIDPTKFKCGETVFFAIGTRAVLNLDYSYEKKADYYLQTDYNQHSVTLGINWTFKK